MHFAEMCDRSAAILKIYRCCQPRCLAVELACPTHVPAHLVPSPTLGPFRCYCICGCRRREEVPSVGARVMIASPAVPPGRDKLKREYVYPRGLRCRRSVSTVFRRGVFEGAKWPRSRVDAWLRWVIAVAVARFK